MIVEQRLDLVFGALSDPIRRAILARLSRGPATVGELSEPHQVSGAAITKHIKVLQNAGLLAQERQGKHRPCRLLVEPLKEAQAWISDRETFWGDHFDRLEKMLAEDS